MSELIERQAAIDAINSWRGRFSEEYNEAIDDCENSIKELPPAQPELSHTQKSCEYCHEDSDGYTRPIEKNCHAYIRFGMNGWELDLKAKGWHGEAQIKFCPMCGRELKGGR